MTRNTTITLLLLLCATFCFAQSSFSYRRPISSLTKEGWYSITLPPDVFKNANTDYSDFRIYQINASDTTEIPYLLRIQNDEVSEGFISLPVLNKSKKDGKLYFTFKQEKGQAINYLDLDFEEENFNGFVQLEGSNDQKEWFELVNHQRILSIKDTEVDFEAMTVHFPVTDYRYLRAAISCDKPLTLRQVSFRAKETVPGKFHAIPNTLTTTQDKTNKQSITEIKLNALQPVSRVSVKISHKGDYYRSFSLETLRDSSQAPNQSWIYYYEPVYNGYLTSIQPNEFEIPMVQSKKLKLIIHHADNAPLTIDSLSTLGPQIELVARLKPGNHFLYYGKPSLSAPSYDLVHFAEQVPDQPTPVTLDQEEVLQQPTERTSPLFENKAWLWAAMAVIIALLGFATLRMMSKK